MSKLVILLATLLLLTPAIASANLVGDPGFEGSGQGPWLDYNWGPQWTANYDATDQVHGGSQSLKLSTGTTVDTWEMVGTKQIFAVQPGYIISGGAWLKWQNLNSVEAYIESKWLNASQVELGTGIGTVHKTSGSGEWEYQDLNMWTVAERTAPAGAAFVDYRLTLLAAGTGPSATGQVWWDDAQFTVIPEPTSLILLGSGLVGLLGLRKRTIK